MKTMSKEEIMEAMSKKQKKWAMRAERIVARHERAETERILAERRRAEIKMPRVLSEEQMKDFTLDPNIRIIRISGARKDSFSTFTVFDNTEQLISMVIDLGKGILNEDLLWLYVEKLVNYEWPDNRGLFEALDIFVFPPSERVYNPWELPLPKTK